MGGERILFQNFVPNSVFLAPSSGYRDVYIGSAVKLKAQDEIYVRISDASVLRNPSANMIGGYMVWWTFVETMHICMTYSIAKHTCDIF